MKRAPDSPARALLASLALLCGAGCCVAAELHVDQASGSDAADGLGWSTARATVGSALASAAASPEADTIRVAAGRYVEQLTVPADTTLLGGYSPGGGSRDTASFQTILDAGGGVAPTVRFPPGSDRTLMEGFVVTGAYSFFFKGGGILVEDSAPLIRGNVIRGNRECMGAGVALVYTAARPAALLEDNVIEDNVGGFRGECDDGLFAAGVGLYVEAPPGVDLGRVASWNRFTNNQGGALGAITVLARATVENAVVSGCDRWTCVHLEGEQVVLRNVLVVSDDRGAGVRLACSGSHRLENVTLIGLGDAAVVSWGGGPGAASVVNSLLWSSGSEVIWRCADPDSLRIDHSLVRGGYPSGTNILTDDPLFVAGFESDAYLSQTSSGQAVTSPAVDAGSDTSLALGFDALTTATNSTPDTGVVDLGFHPRPIASLAIRRGTTPDALGPYRTGVTLPFVDDPGSLSDPALPLLYYLVPGVANEIGVDADRLADAPRLYLRP